MICDDVSPVALSDSSLSTFLPASTSPESTSSIQQPVDEVSDLHVVKDDNVVDEISKLLASDKVMEKDDGLGLNEDNEDLNNLLKNLPVTDGENQGCENKDYSLDFNSNPINSHRSSLSLLILYLFILLKM